jgi:N-acetylglutamate synthase-like GNAT family acetyltransferase
MTTAPKEDGTIEYRKANRGDAGGIFAVLQEVAREIPVSLDTPESEEAMQYIIAECCDCGESWVAVDANGTIVGLALAKPDVLERFHHENEALSLRYIGVTGSRRQHGIFRSLMETLMAKEVPLTATVLHANRCGMADRLAKIGFTKSKSDAKEVQLRWELQSSE